MLVSTTGPYKNFRYRAEVKINDGGNSGLYFRTTRKPGFADGYEAQIDSTHTRPDSHRLAVRDVPRLQAAGEAGHLVHVRTGSA